MSPQSQYVIGLYRDVNPTKNRCRHNIRCPLGSSNYLKMRLNFLIVVRCSLFFARCSLLATFWSLLVPRYFLIVARCSLVFARSSLLVSFCSLPVTFCLLLVTFCSLFFARYFLLVAFFSFARCLLWIKVLWTAKKWFGYNETPPQVFSLQISEIFVTFSGW